MKTTTIIEIIVAIIVIVGAIYWWTTQPAQAPTTESAATSTIPSNTTGDGTDVSQNLILGINAGSGATTNYLSAYNGMTVYTYSPDAATPGESSCTGQCATNWPPYIVNSPSDIHVSAATTGTVGTIVRADGSLQVTYNGKPLYFYIKDANPGDTTGQGVGGVWYVVQP